MPIYSYFFAAALLVWQWKAELKVCSNSNDPKSHAEVRQWKVRSVVCTWETPSCHFVPGTFLILLRKEARVKRHCHESETSSPRDYLHSLFGLVLIASAVSCSLADWTTCTEWSWDCVDEVPHFGCKMSNSLNYFHFIAPYFHTHREREMNGEIDTHTHSHFCAQTHSCEGIIRVGHGIHQVPACLNLSHAHAPITTHCNHFPLPP